MEKIEHTQRNNASQRSQNKILELKNISKSFDKGEVLRNINLYVRQGEFLTLLGPSGCGKTTLLRIIGGFEAPTSGQVFFNGKDITSLPPYMRQVNTVFQHFALFPHMNVYENIAFGLNIKKLPRDEIRRKVTDILALTGLSGFEKRSISRLSGGEKQRVAIARALVCEPSLLLLDEPLGALDLKLRKSMQLELKNMHKKLGLTFVYVTHDQEEAMMLSDTIVVMKDGVLQHIGTPEDIYNEPSNAFVADFIGESNIFPGTYLGDNRVRFADVEFSCLPHPFEAGESVDVVVRPEDIELSRRESHISGVVTSSVFMGVHYDIRVLDDNGHEWLVQSTKTPGEGRRTYLTIGEDCIHIMPKERT
ncbi:MAG: ABC transporter ATP-binding protein [Christensenellaceae bacterium]|nr:ABC transporter ATP-binding protein [Christensenellaceae bacterium]